MIIQCGWCGKTLGEKAGIGTTHGMCAVCSDRLLADVPRVSRSAISGTFALWLRRYCEAHA